MRTHYTHISKHQQLQAELEEKIQDADEFLIHNYYNKSAVEGLVKSIQEVASMEFTTKAAFIQYQQELLTQFGDVEGNFRKTEAKIREGQMALREVQNEIAASLGKKIDKAEMQKVWDQFKNYALY